MAPNLTKAAHYVQLLDDARCQGDWEAVPEFVRKVRKHCSTRVCLTLTAETELTIERATQNLPANKPGIEPLPVPGLDASTQLPPLIAVCEEETNFPQDRFQARVCVGWMHWVLGQYDRAFEELPTSLDMELGPSTERHVVSDWTRVCALKAAYLRANCLSRENKQQEALVAFREGLPNLTSAQSSSGGSSGSSTVPGGGQPQRQLQYWSELFLTEFCMLSGHMLENGEASLEDPNCLASFRSWAKYWEGTQGATLLGGYGFKGSVPRRRIWYEYYSVLSALLEDDLPYPAGYVASGASNHGDASARDQLRIELKRVEAVYEAILLGETTFPRAEDEREEIEEFVQLVMQNWGVMRGRGWREHDLGQGGRESLSRGVLDILYRASTKTYHSTAILRHLFHVHLSVAEFDLAFKALDAYLGLVKKAKARVAKTEIEEPSLDDDATVLETVSLCILALSRYGGHQAAEKAYKLSLELEACLGELRPLQQPKSLGATLLTQPLPENVEETADEIPAAAPPATNLIAHPNVDIARGILATCWQAVGIAHAQWARMTFNAASRTEIQAKAARCLRRSLSSEFGRTANLRGVFSLGLLLAEQRELSTAIELVKSALQAKRSSILKDDKDQERELEREREREQILINGPYWRERAMIPLWHLLALLLSARQDYVTAAGACEGAFRQFQDPSILFGNEILYRSEHLNEADKNNKNSSKTTNTNEKTTGGSSRGLVDEMDDYEKERIVQIKMTQLSLVELTESPRVAVNASLELLSLFARLFGQSQSASATQALPAAGTAVADAPRTSSGTLRSIKGSLFGRSSDGTGRHSSTTAAAAAASEKQIRPHTSQTLSPAIPTIGVDGEDARQTRGVATTSYSEKRSPSAKRHSLRKRERARSRGRGSSISNSNNVGGQSPSQPTIVDGENYFTPLEEGIQGFDFSGRRRLSSPSRGGGSSSGGGPPVSMTSRPGSSSQTATTPAASSIGVASSTAGATAATKSRSTSDADAADLSELGLDGVDPSSSLMAPIQFSKEFEKRRRSTILIEIWLMIAGFYRRAAMLDDAKGALTEAQKLVQALEVDVSKDTTGEVSMSYAGWAGKKSVDELWGDIWAEMGELSLAKNAPYTARLDFEAALTHYADHPTAVVGLSNILLDIYSEKLLPQASMPKLLLADGSVFPETASGYNQDKLAQSESTLPSQPLGLAVRPKKNAALAAPKMPRWGDVDGISVAVDGGDGAADEILDGDEHVSPASDDLPPPYKALSLPLNERLAARDRAFGLLSGLTKLGSAWNNAEAWFALAQAHEESGQVDKAKEALWWCVELEESAGVRPWTSVTTGGYVL